MQAGAEVPWVQSHRNHQTGGNRSQYPWGAIKAAQSCRVIATTSRVTSQLSNLHWPGVGTSNKNKIILAQDVAYVKFLRVYLVLFRVNLCLIWNYFWHFQKEDYAQCFRSRTQAHSWQKPFNLPGCSTSSAHCITRPVPGKFIESIRHQFTMRQTDWLSYQNLCGVCVEAPLVTHNVADRQHIFLFTLCVAVM